MSKGKKPGIKLGVTGGIGSGKTSVCRVFTALGIPVFSADPVAREIMENDKGIMRKIDHIPFGTGFSQIVVPCCTIISVNCDVPFAACFYLLSKQIERKTGMHWTIFTRVIKVTVHIFCKHYNAVYIACFKTIAPFIGIKICTDFGYVLRIMEIEMHLAPWHFLLLISGNFI